MNATSSTARVGWAAAAALLVLVFAWTYSAVFATPAREATPEGATASTPPSFHLPDDGRLGFVEIPGGPFLMGSDKAIDRLAFDNERWSAARAQGEVDVPAFYIGRHEVTVQQYSAFVAAAGHRVDPAALGGPPTLPVTMVSWPDALAYCRWLDQAMRASPATPPAIKERLSQGWKIDLPNEAQWEKAARGTDGRIFPWGNEPRPDRANFRGIHVMPVGSFQCSECAFGLADMSGNVWEWTRSPYQAYPYGVEDDEKDLRADALWVMRGGSFGDPEANVRTAVRGGADPGARRPFIGFRVVLTAR